MSYWKHLLRGDETTYTAKAGSYLLSDGTRLFVESTHPRGRIRVTRQTLPADTTQIPIEVRK